MAIKPPPGFTLEDNGSGASSGQTITPPPGFTLEGEQAAPPETSISQDHPMRRLASNIYHPIIEGGAMTLGGAAGAIAGAPAGPVGSGLAGFAGAASMFPPARQAANAIDTAIGLPPQADTKGTLGDLKTGAYIEAGGLGATAALKPIVKTFGTPIVNTYKDDIEALADKFSVPLTAAARTGSIGLSRMESAVSKIPLASGIMRAFKDGTDNALAILQGRLIRNGASKEEADAVGNGILNALEKTRQEPINQAYKEASDISSKMGSKSTPLEAGKSIQERIAEESQKHQANVVNPLYAKAKEAAGTALSPATNLENTALAIKKEIDGAVGVDPSLLKTVDKILSEHGKPIIFGGNKVMPDDPLYEKLSQMGHKPEGRNYTYSALETTRKNLGELASGQKSIDAGSAGAGAKFNNTVEGRYYAQLAKAAEQDLSNFAGNKEVGTLLGQARESAKSGFQRYSNDYIKSILNANKEDVSKLALKGGAEDFQNLLSVVGEPGKANLKGQVVNDLMEGFGDGFSREGLQKNLKKYGDKLGQLLSPEEMSQLGSVAASRSEIPVENPFFKKYLSDSVRANPSKVINYIAGKGATPSSINRIRATVGEDAWPDVQDQIILHLGTDNTGKFNPMEFSKNVRGKIGLASYKTAFSGPKQEIADALYKLSDAASTPERLAGNPSGTAQSYAAYKLLLELFNNPLRAIKEVGLGAGVVAAHLNHSVTKFIISQPVKRALQATPKYAPIAARMFGSIASQGDSNQ